MPFHQLQAEQIERFRKAWADAGHTREPRVSVSRSIFPIVNDLDRAYFGREGDSQDQVGFLDGGKARFGKTYAGEPDQLIEQLAQDEAIAAADTLLLTIPNQLGVDYCAHVLDSLLTPRRAGARLALSPWPPSRATRRSGTRRCGRPVAPGPCWRPSTRSARRGIVARPLGGGHDPQL